MSDTKCVVCGGDGAAPEGAHPDTVGLCYGCFIKIEEEEAED